MAKDKLKNCILSKRRKGVVFAYIRELKEKQYSIKEIKELVLKEFKFKITPHERTIEGWIKNQSCIYSDRWKQEQALMDKWKGEYEEPKEALTPEEIQLEEMYSMAKPRGLNCDAV